MSRWRPQLFYHPETASRRPLLGCSSCLLGEPVRYDGGNRLQTRFQEWLIPFVELSAVCPEVGIGLGVPRPTLKVITRESSHRVVGVEDENRDVTPELREFAAQHTTRISPQWPLTGWIFKARSPSCGVGSTPIDPGSRAERAGSGAFAATVQEHSPWLPLYEEEDLLQEEDCGSLLLNSFVCHDILWQGSAAVEAQWQHYRALLGNIDEPANNPMGLWLGVKKALGMLGAKERRELLQQYRAC